MMCETGRGVADEYARAFAWFDVAAKLDYRVVTTARDKLQPLMAAEQIVETHKLSTELQERFRQGK
jgi:TPR repeat protein